MKPWFDTMAAVLGVNLASRAFAQQDNTTGPAVAAGDGWGQAGGKMKGETRFAIRHRRVGPGAARQPTRATSIPTTQTSSTNPLGCANC